MRQRVKMDTQTAAKVMMGSVENKQFDDLKKRNLILEHTKIQIKFGNKDFR